MGAGIGRKDEWPIQATTEVPVLADSNRDDPKIDRAATYSRINELIAWFAVSPDNGVNTSTSRLGQNTALPRSEKSTSILFSRSRPSSGS